MNDPNLVYWVWLTQVFGVGNNRVWYILDEFISSEEAYLSLIGGEHSKLTHDEINSVKANKLENSEKLIDYCLSKDMRMASFDHPYYPKRLRNIFNPPTLLFYYGDLEFIDDEIALTVVGTRNPSAYSVRFAQKICDELVKLDIILVSGFALGIDSMAHQAALKRRARTIAVLGCGLDFDYPKENTSAKAVIAKRGAVISEYFPGTRPFGPNFPQRNRILAGLTLGTLVIEASTKSGALNTANEAVQSGRDVFCVVPSDLFNPRYAGVINLIRDGAIPVFSHLDIVNAYYHNFAHKLSLSNIQNDYFSSTENSVIYGRTNQSAANNNDGDEKTKMHQDKAENESNKDKLSEENTLKTDVSIDFTGLTEQQTNAIKTIESGICFIDDISLAMKLDVSEVLSILTELEIYGIVISESGNRYTI